MRPGVRPRPEGRRPAAWAAFLLLAVWAWQPAPAVWAQGEEILIVRVVVDGKPFGIMDLRVTHGGELLFSLENLARLGMTDLPTFRARAIGGQSFLGMSDLFPRLDGHLDRTAATLYLTLQDQSPEEPPRRRDVRTFEPAIVTLSLNGAPVGERIVQLTSAGHVLMPLEDVRGLGVASLNPSALQFIEGTRHVALDDLAPWLTYDLNERAAHLALTVDPARLTPTVVDMGPRSPKGTERVDAPGGFVNYAVDYLTADQGDASLVTMPLEAGERVGAAFAYTNVLFTRNDSGPEPVARLVRQETHVTHDDETRLVRYRFGDQALTSDPLGGAVRIGGVSAAREFGISPHFVRYPGIALSGTLDTPSDVEVYSNGILIRRDRLPAGEFTYEDLPRTTGAGDSEIVIRDAFGRESRIATPFYVSPQLLKRGLSSFRYALGVRRERFGAASFDYGGPVLSVTHRTGLTQRVTGGLRVEEDTDVVNGGPDVVAVLGRFGEVDAAAAWSRDDGRTGNAWRAAYAYGGRTVGVRLSGLGRSREYSTVSLAAEDGRVRRDLQGSVSVRVPVLGSVSVSHRLARIQPGPNLERTSVFFARPLGWGTSLFMRASRSRLDDVEDDLFVGITRYLGGGRSATLDWQQHEETATARATLQRNAPLGPGWGYRLEGSRTTYPVQEDRDVGDAYLEYHGPYGVYQAEARAETGAESYRASAAGAVAWTEGTVGATRPVHDAFALVRVPGVAGVRVYHDSRLAARTGAAGTALVPDLLSYVDNRITIDPTDLPLGYDLVSDIHTITVPYRGTGEVAFAATRTQAVVGRVMVREGRAKVPAELTWMTVKDGATTLRLPVGRGGEFYLENPAPGDHAAEVTWKDRECAFTIDVPESSDVMVDVGEVVCETR
jgi:outer membrane usher protein